MKIERVECIPMVYHMEHPIYSGTGRCDARQLLLVRIYEIMGWLVWGQQHLMAVLYRPLRK